MLQDYLVQNQDAALGLDSFVTKRQADALYASGTGVTASALLTAYTLPTAAALALTNGNIGTLLRLRGMVVPCVLWISAVGFCSLLDRMSASSRGLTHA